jgi:hypothetical protein
MTKTTLNDAIIKAVKTNNASLAGYIAERMMVVNEPRWTYKLLEKKANELTGISPADWHELIAEGEYLNDRERN